MTTNNNKQKSSNKNLNTHYTINLTDSKKFTHINNRNNQSLLELTSLLPKKPKKK